MPEKKKMMHIGLYKGDIGEYVLLPGSPERAERLSHMLEDATEVAYNREYRTYTGKLDGIAVSVTSTGMGGPSTAIAVEELRECGAHTIIRVGTCESLSNSVHVGQVVLPNGAVRMEGVANHYSPPEFPAVPDMEVLAALEAAAREVNAVFHIGIAVTKAVFSSQYAAQERPICHSLKERWYAYRSAGALCAEMGCAPMFTAAGSLQMRAAAVLGVAFENDRYSDDAADWNEDCEEIACRVAVEAVRKLINHEKEPNL